MTTINFSEDFPKALHKDSLERLHEVLPLVKHFLHRIEVSMKGSDFDQEGEASIAVARRYHAAHLWLDPTFFKLTIDEQRITLLHEMMHVVLDAYTMETQQILRTFAPEELKSYLSWKVEEEEERAVDALALAFWEVKKWT